MSQIISASPTITDMIREEHAQVMSTLHQYRAESPSDAKQKLVNTVGLALENQALLKAEIFYPALRALAADEEVLLKSEAAHRQMRSLIGQLRDMQPTASHYDDTVATLTQIFDQHTAEEEAALLPQAEWLLRDQLRKLGLKMRTRQLVMSGPSLRQVGTVLLAFGGFLAGGYLIKRALERRA